MRVIGLLIAMVFILSAASALSESVYRYKDEKGRWQFTDKKPKEKHQVVKLKPSVGDAHEPKLYVKEINGLSALMASNPWHAPVTFDLYNNGNRVYTWVAEPITDEAVLMAPEDAAKVDLKRIDYRSRMGRVIKGSDGKSLRPPIPPVGKYKVTQGFNGRFSHHTQGNIYAVDIAMDVDDIIHAARDGIVVFVKDDYHMGGTNAFFFDKANHVTVLHADDTFAVYGHILLGSALVKPGDKIKAGDPLANTGTSGYSTGPHLHFVVSYNSGEATLSTPFVFEENGRSFSPRVNQWLSIGR